MNRTFRPTRIAALMVFFVGILAVYATVLYQMQIYEAVQFDAEADMIPVAASSRIETIRAGRGDILDRNGVLLVSGRPAYDVTLSRSALLAATNTNDIILDLIYLAIESGTVYNDTFPITAGAPYEYRHDMSAQQRTRLDKYFEYHELDPEISAADLIVWLKTHYKIPYTTSVSDARLIIGVRYEMEIRVVPGINLPTYTFAEDITTELVAIISERAFPGVTIEINSRREYHTDAAAHLLGYLGRMDAADYEKYSQIGYPMDAVIGKSGAEAAFEQYLHGTDGERYVETSADGTVVTERVRSEPKAGNNVYLTIDIELQKATEAALSDHINNLNLEREEGEKSTNGAVVVTDVNTAELLAMASYPPFDLETREGNEFNYAAQGTYSPGSTFKMVTALAGMRAGVIARNTVIEDKGQFTMYESYRPNCWIYTASAVTHGHINVVQALQVSCNYFFYQVAYETLITPIATAARDFGFGAKTGIEITESAGVVATPDYKRETFGEGWWDADTLLVSIGQGLNEFTPVQLANYAATIANGGYLYNMTMLNGAKTPDYSGTVYKHEPSLRSEIEEKDMISVLREGMRAAVSGGTANNEFGNYQVQVAAKTGTVQTGAEWNDGMFVCYAPANDPQIAVAVAVKKGGSGAEIMQIARTVMDAYFDHEVEIAIVGDGALIP